jgi:hypothetical protein
MVAMLIGCGLRRTELLDLRRETTTRQEPLPIDRASILWSRTPAASVSVGTVNGTN